MHRLQRVRELTNEGAISSEALAEAVRRERGQVLATLTRRLGDLDLAEEAVQDAAVAALRRWPRDGVPRNPVAWLTTVARNAALDRLRREASRGAKEEAAVPLVSPEDEPAEPTVSTLRDDLLGLVFTCCHPALGADARVALALRTLCGLTTEEVARAFLVPEATMAQRVVRAKRKIAVARIPYRVPTDAELPERLPAVLAVVYVVFTEAHHSASDPGLVRIDLAEEAIRLARLLVEAMPDEPECAGLLALLLATHARRDARLNAAGDLVLLADQDRTKWDRSAIEEASVLVDRSLRRGRTGPYLVQAAIACLHGLAPSHEETDWSQIVELYGILFSLVPTPVVAVNRAAAVAHVAGPEAGLVLLNEVAGATVDRWHLYHSARAELLRRAGQHDAAADAYESALACECNPVDRRFLERRLANLRQ